MSLVAHEILSGLLERLRSCMPEALYEQWFAGSEIMSWDDELLELGVKNRFFKSWIETKYIDILRKAAADVVGREVRVAVSVSPRLFAPFREAQERDKAEAAKLAESESGTAFVAPPAPRRGKNSGMELNPDFTFDAFVVGPSNRLSHAVALRAVDRPGEYGRIYFCGEHGVGKTHLLQAICCGMRDQRPEATVMYLTCERFVADFVAAHGSGKLKEFRARFRECDVLALDQVQSLGQGNKAATQSELIGIIDQIEARGAQAVFAATLAPGELEGVDPKLRDRLGAGFVDRLFLPDENTRRELLVRKLAEKGVAVPEAAVALMAKELTGNVRKLEGTVNRLAALIGIEGMEPSVSCIRMALDVSTPGAKKAVLTHRDIIDAVAEEYGVTPEAVIGRGRALTVRRARQVAFVLCRKLLNARYAELGEVFGGRSHATVISAIRGASPDMFGGGLEARPVERILFRLRVNIKPEELLERQRGLFE